MRTRTIRWVLVALVLALGTGAPGAAAAQQGNYNGHCRKLTKQIDHFEGVADLARSRDNDLWEASTEAHIDRLRNRRSRLCPAYDRELADLANAKFWAETYELLKAGAKGAVRYMTFGAF